MYSYSYVDDGWFNRCYRIFDEDRRIADALEEQGAIDIVASLNKTMPIKLSKELREKLREFATAFMEAELAEKDRETRKEAIEEAVQSLEQLTVNYLESFPRLDPSDHGDPPAETKAGF